MSAITWPGVVPFLPDTTRSSFPTNRRKLHFRSSAMACKASASPHALSVLSVLRYASISVSDEKHWLNASWLFSIKSAVLCRSSLCLLFQLVPWQTLLNRQFPSPSTLSTRTPSLSNTVACGLVSGTRSDC